jgi:hypothetical protein
MEFSTDFGKVDFYLFCPLKIYIEIIDSFVFDVLMKGMKNAQFQVITLPIVIF